MRILKPSIFAAALCLGASGVWAQTQGAPTFGALTLQTPLAPASGGTGASSLAAFGRIATVKVTKFTASGTYTPSTGMIYAQLECVAGGGGSGGVPAGTTGNVTLSGAGGSGSYSRALVSAATVGASKAVTVGVAGTAGAAGANYGGAGGASAIGSLVTTNGGTGGVPVGGSSAAYILQGGTGGSAGTGDIAIAGNPGGISIGIAANSVASGGSGGASYFGGAGIGGSNGGGSGGQFGGGAGGDATVGATAQAAGAAGGPGLCIVTEFLNQ